MKLMRSIFSREVVTPSISAMVRQRITVGADEGLARVKIKKLGRVVLSVDTFTLDVDVVKGSLTLRVLFGLWKLQSTIQ